MQDTSGPTTPSPLSVIAAFAYGLSIGGSWMLQQVPSPHAVVAFVAAFLSPRIINCTYEKRLPRVSLSFGYPLTNWRIGVD